MKRTKVKWSLRAKETLLEIKEYIARSAPKRATSFVQRLRKQVDRLKYFPELGGRVEGVNDPEIREIYYGNYRIIYRYDGKEVLITGVYHGARLLDPRIFLE